MPASIFHVVESATRIHGVENLEILGAKCVLEYQLASTQNREQWQLELRPPNGGAAQFNLARDAKGRLLLAVGNCEPIDLSKNAGPSERAQRDLALKILTNLIQYGMTEVRIMKGDQETIAIPILGDRDGVPMEDTKDMNVETPRRFRIYHYAPYEREEHSREYEHIQPKEPIEWL